MRQSKESTPNSNPQIEPTETSQAATSSVTSAVEECETPKQPSTSVARTRSSVPSLRGKWDTFGNCLFDVKSATKVNKSYFDEKFYEDQNSIQNQQMLLTKVTKEYALQEETRKKSESAKKMRKANQQANLTQ